MNDLKTAIRMAQLFAEVAADTSGVACVCVLGPCPDGVHWAVLAEGGAKVAAGVVAVAVEAREDMPAEEVRRVASGRN